jgi:hypothetical protein
LRASLAHLGASPLYGRGTPYPPVGSRGLATRRPPLPRPEPGSALVGLRLW